MSDKTIEALEYKKKQLLKEVDSLDEVIDLLRDGKRGEVGRHTTKSLRPAILALLDDGPKKITEMQDLIPNVTHHRFRYVLDSMMKKGVVELIPGWRYSKLTRLVTNQ